MRTRTLAAAAAIAALAAGCDVGGRQVAVDEEVAVARPMPVEVEAGVGGAPGEGPQFVTPRPGMADVTPRTFESATASDDGSTVTVLWWSGVEPCNVLDRVEVEYAADTVAITVFEGSDPAEPDAACIEVAVQKGVVLKLAEPLDGRAIVDGAAGG